MMHSPTMILLLIALCVAILFSGWCAKHATD